MDFAGTVLTALLLLGLGVAGLFAYLLVTARAAARRGQDRRDGSGPEDVE